MDSSRLQSSRAAQFVFVILLVTCLGQVAWWTIDQANYSQEVIDRTTALYKHEAQVARELVTQDGLSTERVRELLPAVSLEGGPAPHATVAPERIQALENVRDDRNFRYSWEAGFFVLVLISTVGLVGVTLRQRTELLRRQQNFLAAVSHELKSPLASLKLSAETLLLRDPDKDGRKRIADRMVQSTERLGGMVTNLLDAARLDEGRVDLAPELLELRRAVAHAIDPVACMAHVHATEILNEVPDDLTIFADPVGVESVVANLVGNAFKSVKASGGGTVRITAEPERSGVRLRVIDDGLGFEPKLAHQLFEKFFRPGSELVRRTKGAGLGLHIVRRFVELEGGRIDAHSDGEGQGATFSVWWHAKGRSTAAEAGGSP